LVGLGLTPDTAAAALSVRELAQKLGVVPATVYQRKNRALWRIQRWRLRDIYYERVYSEPKERQLSALLALDIRLFAMYLSPRSEEAIQRLGIRTLGALVTDPKMEERLRSDEQLGSTGVDEIRGELDRLGLRFGMEAPPDGPAPAEAGSDPRIEKWIGDLIGSPAGYQSGGWPEVRRDVLDALSALAAEPSNRPIFERFILRLRAHVDVEEVRALFLRMAGPRREILNPDLTSSLAVSTRVLNNLEKQGLETIAELLETPEEEIRSEPGFGDGSLEELKRALSDRGLALRSEDSLHFLDVSDEVRQALVDAGYRFIGRIDGLSRWWLEQMGWLTPEWRREIVGAMAARNQPLQVLPNIPKILVVDAAWLAETAPETAERIGPRKKGAQLALVRADAPTASELSQLTRVISHQSVLDGVVGRLLPRGAYTGGMQIVSMETGSSFSDRNNALLQGAASDGERTIFALDGRYFKRLTLPRDHPPTFLLRPDTWQQIDPDAFAVYLARTGPDQHLILDLTQGSIVRLGIDGREYYAVDISA